MTTRLSENPITGYRWEIENARGLELVRGNFKKAGNAIGAGGVRIFHFRALDEGSHKLSIKKLRDWEEEISIVEHFYATCSKVNLRSHKMQSSKGCFK